MRSVALALSFALVLLACPAAAQRPDLVGPSEKPSSPPEALPEPEPEPEPEPRPGDPRYGALHSFQITNDFAVGGYSTTVTNSEARNSGIYVEPALDWFVLEHLAIGLGSDVAFSSAKGYDADGSLVQRRHSSIGGAARILYALPLGRRATFAPRASLGLDWVQTDQTLLDGRLPLGSPLGIPKTTIVGPYVALYAPLLLQAAPHFFLGFGPSVYHVFARAAADTSAGGMQTTLALHGTVGIWWGGEREATEEEMAPKTPDPPRAPFGRAGHVVLDGSLDAAVYSTSYAGVPSTSTSFGASPGVDYFVSSWFLIGIGFSFSVSHSKNLTPGDASTTTTSDATLFGVAPRLGVNIPLGSFFSLYPRAYFRIGHEDIDLQAGTAKTNQSALVTTVGIGAPLLAHVADHAFIGFGPYIADDLSRKLDKHDQPQPVDKQVLGTTVGASALIGGWL